MREYTPEYITKLNPNEILVFGSNVEGRHKKGAALTAYTHFGAILGQPEGLQGQSYAIITKKNWRIEKSSTLLEILTGINAFVRFAITHPEYKFYVTKIGSSLAGYTVNEIKEQWSWSHFAFFDKGGIPDNVILPEEYEVRD